jgi:sugar-phosphatase
MIQAVIFDMDGLLIDSEPLWEATEIEVFSAVGLALTGERCKETTGLRTDEVVAHWLRLYPWSAPAPEEVERRLISGVIARIGREGAPKPGMARAIALARARSEKVALASSSSYAVISAAVARLGIGTALDLIYSAEEEEYGKPHPGVYLTAAKRLGVPPSRCLALEDSLNGVLAAKAARMRCIAVPEGEARRDPRFAIADARLDSLEELSADLWERLAG